MTNGDINQWLQRARDFLAEHESNHDAMYHTVRFLLDGNYLGINHRVPMDDIVDYLGRQRIILTREGFQQTVLGELKRNGIAATLVYPGAQGGVFIPSCEDDVATAVSQVLERIASEVSNLRGIVRDTRFADTIRDIEECLSRIRGRSDER